MNESTNHTPEPQCAGEKPMGKMGGSYGRFAAMIATSTIVM